ncbi:MAG TPA: peptidase E [Candidatus Marinimicrobia bacterium]|nr:peptidase E [Candidatus Neomarinimicrobiota bacterium]
MNNKGQIIAIGGGGFGRNPNQRIIEQYILDQSDTEIPKVVFIPTASAEDKAYIVNFYACFNKLNCAASHITFFERTPRLDGIMNKADVVYVGGGNTKSMLAVWREWKLDKLLRKAYNRGAILAGVSAGAICWFEQGITDSWASNLNVLNCLGFLSGSCCPHYDSEMARRPSVHKFLEDGKLKSGYAIEDGAALHFNNGKFHKALAFLNDAKVYFVEAKDNVIFEEPLVMNSL